MKACAPLWRRSAIYISIWHAFRLQVTLLPWHKGRRLWWRMPNFPILSAKISKRSWCDQWKALGHLPFTVERPEQNPDILLQKWDFEIMYDLIL